MFNATVLLRAVRSRPAVLVAGLLMGGTLAPSDTA
jgi:hypothetical protein